MRQALRAFFSYVLMIITLFAGVMSSANAATFVNFPSNQLFSIQNQERSELRNTRIFSPITSKAHPFFSEAIGEINEGDDDYTRSNIKFPYIFTFITYFFWSDINIKNNLVLILHPKTRFHDRTSTRLTQIHSSTSPPHLPIRMTADSNCYFFV